MAAKEKEPKPAKTPTPRGPKPKAVETPPEPFPDHGPQQPAGDGDWGQPGLAGPAKDPA